MNSHQFLSLHKSEKHYFSFSCTHRMSHTFIFPPAYSQSIPIHCNSTSGAITFPVVNNTKICTRISPQIQLKQSKKTTFTSRGTFVPTFCQLIWVMLCTRPKQNKNKCVPFSEHVIITYRTYILVTNTVSKLQSWQKLPLTDGVMRLEMKH